MALQTFGSSRQSANIERIRTFERGNFGDRAFVGRGVSEIRIHYGPGYRIYYCRTGVAVYILLCGGTKGTQQRDIAKAQSMLARLQRN